MYLTIRSPIEVVWEGDVDSVESENPEGVFTILPDHANFMTPLKDTDLIVYVSDGKEQTFALSDAVLYFKDNTIKVYVHDAREAPEVADEVVTEPAEEAEENKATS